MTLDTNGNLVACLEGAGFQRTLEMFDGIGSLDVLTDLMSTAEYSTPKNQS